MGALRDRMVREMSLRELSASTQKLYLATVTDLARYHHQSPDTLDPMQVRGHMGHTGHGRPPAGPLPRIERAAPVI
jgi:hypothetical protein